MALIWEISDKKGHIVSEIELILSNLATLANEICLFLGSDPGKHGMLQGSFQMALVEAQGGGTLKATGGLPSSTLQSTADLAGKMNSTLFTRGQIVGRFDHFNQMRGTANGLVTRLNSMNVELGKLGSQSPEAVKLARQGYQPLMTTATQRIELTMKVEEAIIEITNSGNAERLKSFVLTTTPGAPSAAREAENLAEIQLQNRGVTLLPNAVSNGQALMQKIRELPVNSREAAEQAKELARKGGAGVSAALSAFRAASPVVRSAVRTAITSIGEALVGFGSRLTMPILVIDINHLIPGASDFES